MQKYSNETRLATDEEPTLVMTWDVLQNIIKTIGSRPAESGGVIGGNGYGKAAISHYHFDEASRNSSVTYSPDDKGLNRLLKDDWNPNGIRLRGFVHSHPGWYCRPSHGDEVYAARILAANDDMDKLLLPIANTIPDTGKFSLTPFAAIRDESKQGVRIVRGRIILLSDGHTKGAIEALSRRFFGEIVAQEISFDIPLEELVINGRAKRETQSRVSVSRWHGAKQERVVAPVRQPCDEAATTGGEEPPKPSMKPNMRDTFDRVRNAYDIPLLSTRRIIAVGAGGARSWLDELARTGLSQFGIIDPGKYEEPNLATQQCYRGDIGRPKVDCIAERILDINPAAKIVKLHKGLEELSDDEIRRLAFDPIEGRESSRTVICGLTDDFFAQARVNRLALHLGIPSLAAQVYHEGRGAEVTFTFPGVTPACHRCALSSRYRHYLDKDGKNSVTSHGTPIFATSRLNALKGFVMLALLHHGSSHPRWGRLLSRIGNRNLIQIRMDPDFSANMGFDVFDRVLGNADQERLLFDETVWLPQMQDCPATGGYPHCPDCGGTGDLRDAVGKFKDTREMLPTNPGPWPIKA